MEITHAAQTIGLTGFISSGKSTAADYLVSQHGFELASFAAPLKQSVSNLFEISLDDIEAHKNDANCTITLAYPSGMKLSMTLRTFLQRYGTEAHRDVFGQDFWVDFAMFSLKPGVNYVFADCRFPNEAEAIRSVGGKIVRVVRPGQQQPIAGAHASEQYMQPDGVIQNSGTVEDLYTMLDTMVAFPDVITKSTMPDVF